MKTQFIVYPVKPFSFELTKKFLFLFDPTKSEYKIIDDFIIFGVHLKNQSVVVYIKDIGFLEQPKLEINIVHNKALPKQLDKLQNDIIRRFSFEKDLTCFYSILEADESSEKILNALYGYHPVLFSSIESCGIWAILTQYNSMKNALKQKELITKFVSPKINIGCHSLYSFPTIDQLLSIDESDMIRLVGNKKKSDYIQNFLNAISELEDDIYSMKYQDVLNFLLSIKGIGKWSAEFILLRGLGRSELVPLSEARNIEIIYQRYGNDIDISRLLSSYSTFQGDWIHYLRVFDYLKFY